MAAAHDRQYRKPLKWFTIPQLFRYERQQKGRLREHFQFNADILGEPSVAADAELVALLVDSLRALGLQAEDFVVRLSSRNAWQEFHARRSPDPAQAYEFFQVIDKLEREAPAVSETRLAALGFSLAEVRDFIAAGQPTPELQRLLDDLAARGLADFVRVDYGVIRGLAYYTGPVFEAFDRRGEFRAIAGGGRYDGLVKLISGGKVDMPALGFGMGDVVLTELLKARGLAGQTRPALDVFVLIEDETLRSDSLGCVQQLRQTGVAVDYALAPAKSDKQFKRAIEAGARATLRLERQPDGGVLARLKRLATREESLLPLNEITGPVQSICRA
jgi:histidyl-tRNA synthetase